jgi:hypothetical protein
VRTSPDNPAAPVTRPSGSWLKVCVPKPACPLTPLTAWLSLVTEPRRS